MIESDSLSSSSNIRSYKSTGRPTGYDCNVSTRILVLSNFIVYLYRTLAVMNSMENSIGASAVSLSNLNGIYNGISSPTRLSIFSTQRRKPYINLIILVFPEAFAPKIKEIFKARLSPSASVAALQMLSGFALEDVGSVVKEQHPLNDRKFLNSKFSIIILRIFCKDSILIPLKQIYFSDFA